MMPGIDAVVARFRFREAGRLRTVQQYDPLGALGSRTLAIGTGSVAVVWAVLASIFARDVPGSPLLSVVTVVLVALFVVVTAVASNPFRAPFTRSASIGVVVLLGLATVTGVAAQWGPDRHPANDFMALVTGIGVLTLAPYRPWPEVVGAGLTLAVVDGVVFGAAAVAFPAPVHPLVIAVLAATPTLVLTLAAATFGATFVAFAERVQIRAGSYSVARAEQDGIARVVQQERVEILAREVAPFFDGIRERGVITDDDRARAREIADGIRRVMVAEADATWLDQAVRGENDLTRIEDRDGVIRSMDVDQRTVVRTFLRALLRDAVIDPARVRITVAERTPAGSGAGARTPAGRGLFAVTAFTTLASSGESAIHRAFDPYLAVLRATFTDLEVEVRPASLAVRFSYDQH